MNTDTLNFGSPVYGHALLPNIPPHDYSSIEEAASTARSVYVDLDDLKTIKSAGGFGPIQCCSGALLVTLLAAAVVVPFFITPLVTAQETFVSTTSTSTTTTTTSSETTTSVTTSTSTSTSTTTTDTTTTSETTTTTTEPCTSGYSRSPSGTCVNLQIDFYNCGSFGYVCASNYTSCSAGSCSGAPAVQLSGAIAVPGWNGQVDVDDQYTTVTLPLNLTLYGYSSSTVSVTSNGVVCLDVCSTAYTNGNLPTSNFGGPTAFGFWDDLMIYSGTSQTVYYNVAGTTPNRITTFEFYESHYGQSTEYYHFQIIFYENQPDIVKYVYFEISDGGSSATIGVQSTSSGPAITYSVNQANAVAYNTTLIFDTNAGTYSG